MATTILVAFTIEEDDYDAAEAALLPLLPAIGGPIESWWVAEDRRNDGSDNDSAVFVSPGLQHVSSALLFDAGFTPSWNITERIEKSNA